jgi:hypothetical protein
MVQPLAGGSSLALISIAVLGDAKYPPPVTTVPEGQNASEVPGTVDTLVALPSTCVVFIDTAPEAILGVVTAPLVRF